MAKSKPNPRAAMLLADECFASSDDRFVENLRNVSTPAPLIGLVERWKKDPRPWARQQILAYLDQPLNRAGHQPVVRRLFKWAEASRDDELMGAFLRAFDRSVRYVRRTVQRWDAVTRSVHPETELYAPRDGMIGAGKVKRKDWRTGKINEVDRQVRTYGTLFSRHTRKYLRRRAWRYFRWLAFRRPELYVPAVTKALARYVETDLNRGEHMLESWGFVHICFGEHPALEFNATQVRLREDRSLTELSAAPRFLELWQKPEAGAALVELLFQAQARPVRVWAMQLLEREHAHQFASLSVDRLLDLLNHSDEELQQLGVRLLNASTEQAKWPVATWLRLIEVRNPATLSAVCDAMLRHVSASRLDLPQTIQLASASPTPVARLGFKFLQAREIRTPADRSALAGLAQAKCDAVAGELARWALGIIGSKEHYDREAVSAFFDSLARETRTAAWAWLRTPGSPGYEDAALWSRLVETPFDDVRQQLIESLNQRTAQPLAVTRGREITPVWAGVLLAVFRGGRQKPKAIEQITRTLLDEPARAAELLPVLAVAVRSIRGPELRAGLSAVVTLAMARPELAEAVQSHLPELRL